MEECQDHPECRMQHARDLHGDCAVFLEAKEAGAEIITIDPNFCTTAEKSSRWIPMIAGTDPALYLGMISLILDKGWYNAPYLKAYTSMPFMVKRSDGSLLRKDPVDDIKQAGSENPFGVG
ncbi:MAG: hypothetical protein ACLSVD_05570 [Eggerthellaceae bacterium]